MISDHYGKLSSLTRIQISRENFRFQHDARSVRKASLKMILHQHEKLSVT
jgi:hypothetical protein